MNLQYREKLRRETAKTGIVEPETEEDTTKKGKCRTVYGASCIPYFL